MSQKTKAKKHQPRKVFLLCRGVVIGKSHARAQAYIQVCVKNGTVFEQGDEVIFSGITGTFAGLVYQAEVKIKNGQVSSVFPHSFTYDEEMTNGVSEDVRAMHSAKSDANTLELLVRSKHKKAARDRSSIFDAMLPLRQAYKKTNGMGKMAMEVRLLHYLRTGR